MDSKPSRGETLQANTIDSKFPYGDAPKGNVAIAVVAQNGVFVRVMYCRDANRRM